MSDKELEEYINKIEPNFDSHLEKGTIEMSKEYYNLLEEKMARLINKNQELKQQLLEKKCSDKYIEYKEKNQKYKEIIDKVLEDIKEYKEMGYSKYYENEIEIELIDKILQILDGGEKDK